MAGLMNPALRDFWRTKTRYKVLYGGRASSKSYDTALHTLRLSRVGKFKILAVRQFQSNIRESVYTLLKDQIYRIGIQDEYDILHNTIRHKKTGSEFIFMGIQRNIEEIKSLEGVDILWIEEGGLLTKEQWDIIEPTIRKEGSEIYIVFNPRNRNDFVWQTFVEKPRGDSIVRSINYDDNPFLSTTMLQVIERAKEEDYEEYAHIYLGKVREGDEKALFTFDEVEKAMDNSLEAMKNVDMTGVFSYAVDVARYGKDKSVRTKRRGFRIYDLVEYKGRNTSEIASVVNSDRLSESDKGPDAIFIDTIGVGAGVYDKLSDLGARPIEANVSMKADKIDLYYNKRAEIFFRLRDFVRKGGKIPYDLDLREELLAIQYKFNNNNGKIIIQPKDEIKETIGRSPDKSDSVALHFFSDVAGARVDMASLQKQNFKRIRK